MPVAYQERFRPGSLHRLTVSAQERYGLESWMEFRVLKLACKDGYKTPWVHCAGPLSAGGVASDEVGQFRPSDFKR